MCVRVCDRSTPGKLRVEGSILQSGAELFVCGRHAAACALLLLLHPVHRRPVSQPEPIDSVVIVVVVVVEAIVVVVEAVVVVTVVVVVLVVVFDLSDSVVLRTLS